MLLATESGGRGTLMVRQALAALVRHCWHWQRNKWVAGQIAQDKVCLVAGTSLRTSGELYLLTAMDHEMKVDRV